MTITEWCGKVPGTAWASSAALIAAVVIGGCQGSRGPDLVPVTGKVVQDGNPVAGADVMFMAPGAAPSSGKTDATGRFELTFNDGRPGAVPGKHHVMITIPGPETPPPTGEEEAPPEATPTPEFHKDVEVKATGENDITLDISQ